MLEKDILRLERALGTLVERGAPRGAVLAAPASVAHALRDLAGEEKAAALASLALRGARELLLVPDLVRCLADPDRRVRHAAAVLLESTAAEVGFGPFAPDAVEALLAALRDEDGRVRTSAIAALASIRYADAGTVERVLDGISHTVLDGSSRRSLFALVRAVRTLLGQLPPVGSGGPVR